MRSVREHVAQSKKLSYKYQKEAWLLDALEIYCVAVSSLFAEAKLQRPSSPGFAGLLGYLADYVNSTGFRELSGDITSLKVQLASIRYDLLINSGAVTVTRYNEEPDYEAEIQDDFEKFKQGDVSDYLFKFSDFVGINHIEAGVLERVGRLFPGYICGARRLCRASFRRSRRYDLSIRPRSAILYFLYRVHVAISK